MFEGIILPDLTKVKNNVYRALKLFLHHVGMMSVRFRSLGLLADWEGPPESNRELKEAPTT